MSQVVLVQGCIYGLYDSEDNCLYVGQSIRHKDRENDHRRLLKQGNHHCNGLQEWYDTAQNNNLVFKIIEKVEKDSQQLYERELFWFEELKPKFWSKKPGMKFIWDDLSDDVKDKVFSGRRVKREESAQEFKDRYSKDILELYVDNGLTILEVAEKLEISYSRVYSILKETNSVRQSNARQNPFIRSKSDEYLREELSKRIANKESFASISREWNVPASTLGTLAYELGVYTKRVINRGILDEYTEEELKDEIERDYIVGNLTSKDLSKRWGVSRKTTYTTIYKFFPPDGDGYRRAQRKTTKIYDAKKFKKLWRDKTIKELAAYYNCQEATVIEKAKELDLINNEMNCGYCNERFVGRRSDAKFCSVKCRNTFHSRKRAQDL